MGADRSPAGDLRGLLVPDPRISLSTLKAIGAGALDSSYTQSGPRTGLAVADQDTGLVLLTSGDQGANGDIEIRTQRAGGIGIERAGYVWRDVEAGDSTSQYKGWDGPQLVTGWETLYWSLIAVGTEIRPSTITLQSGRLLCAYLVTAAGVVFIKRYDPSTSTWTSVNLTPTGASTSYITAACGLLQLPSGRVLAFVGAPGAKQIDAYYSDDEGATWAVHGYRILNVGLSVADMLCIRAAYSAGEVLLIVEWDAGAQLTASHYASSDLGASFDSVTASWFVSSGEKPQNVDIVPLKHAGFLVVYYDGTAVDVRYRRFGSAWGALSNYAATVFTTNPNTSSVAAWRADDGSILLLFDAMSPRMGVLYRSTDDGATFGAFFADASGTIDLRTAVVATERLTNWSVAESGGRTALVCRATAAGSAYDTQSVMVVWLGGFSTHTAPLDTVLSSTEDWDDTSYIGWGTKPIAGDYGGLYLPITTPDQMDWTAIGGGTDGVTSGALDISTTVVQSRYYERTYSPQREQLFVEFAVKIDAGDGNTGADEITVRLRLNDFPASTWEREVTLRLADTGYRLYDEVAAANVAAAVTFDLTTRGHIRVAIDKDGNVRTWHARAGHVRSWTAGTTGTLADGGVGSGAATRVRFGHTSNASNGSNWALVGYCEWGNKWGATQTGKLASSWSNPGDLHAHTIPASPAPVWDSVRMAGADGPTRYGETQRVKAEYDYPVRHVFPTVDPSPRVTWRSVADEADMYLTWDLSGYSTRMLNHSLGAALLGTNLATATVEYYDGAAWQTLISLNASDGWSSLAYTRTGDVVHVNTGVATGSRWLPYGAAVGSTFQLDATTFRKIVEHSEGAWEDATTKRPWVRLDGITGAEPASGTGKIIWRSFGATRAEWDTAARYLRLKIPSQVTAAGFYEIGQVVIGPLVIFGYQWSRGWNVRRRATIRRSEWRDGQSRITRLGPVERSWEIAWTDGTDVQELAGTAASPDYVAGSNGGLPVAARAEGLRLMEQVLAAGDGPSRPVLLLPAITRGTGSKAITMQEGLIWGRLSEESNRDNIIGDELSTEVERSGKYVLTELT